MRQSALVKGRAAAWLALLAWVASGCGDSAAPSTEVDGAGDVGDTAPDIDQDDAPDDSGDGATGDAADTDDDGASDTADTVDATDGSGGPDAGQGGGVGDPCDDDSDCAYPICLFPIPELGQGICTLPCTDTSQCPANYDCVLLEEAGADDVRVCYPSVNCYDPDSDLYGLGPDCLGPDCNEEDPNTNPQALEVCDGYDNDCDTLIDDSPVGEGNPCSTSFPGVCGDGQLTCRDGLQECVQSTLPSDEVCDGLDNDCDTFTDEDADGALLQRSCYDGAAGTAGVGACTAGIQTCEADGFGACVGQRVPAAEACDEIDNDCDGTVDNGTGTTLWYPDLDADGFGDARATPTRDCVPPAGWVLNALDCNDNNSLAYPGAAETTGDAIDQNCDGTERCWVDADLDGFHGLASTLTTDLDCAGAGLHRTSQPGGDCDDSDRLIRPGVVEFPGDEIDQNCDGLEICYVDADNDGYRIDDLVDSPNTICTNPGEAAFVDPDGDCNDAVDTIRPGALEACDGIDQDCDTIIDEDVTYSNWWPDGDGDGYGSTAVAPVSSCAPIAGSVTTGGDCDDTAPAIRPGVTELVGDEIDQNCDGAELCLPDADNDGYRALGTGSVTSADVDCADSGEANASEPGGDCNDGVAAINPAGIEAPADGIDQDCDTVELCFIDIDRDGYRASADTVSSPNLVCTDAGEAGATAPLGDCDDTVATRNPGALELCDGIDQDCDSLIDEGVTERDWYPDTDGDTFGDAGATPVRDCGTVAGHVLDSSDCDDTDADVRPGAAEGIADGVDQNCDGRELCYPDADRDGYRSTAGTSIVSSDTDCNDAGEALATLPDGDCNDAVAAVRPGATELPADGIDQNCDTVELCYLDADRDGYRPDATSTVTSPNLTCTDAGEAAGTAPATDCNDAAASINPGATEVPADGVDQNCDGNEVCYVDNDNDGYRPNATATRASVDLACDASGEAIGTDPVGDCNDLDAAIRPGATEGTDDGVDQNCDGLELCFIDADDDGYRPLSGGTVTSIDLDCSDFGEASGSELTTDCNDLSASVRPGATEVVNNGVDDNCDGFEVCYVDADNDNYRPASGTTTSADLDCDDDFEASSSTPLGDCNDADATISPGVPERPADDFDQNCDGTEICYLDFDGDGYRPGTGTATVASVDLQCTATNEAYGIDPTGDCNDSNAAINPGATEVVASGGDQNCDGIELCYLDGDDDGARQSAGATIESTTDADCTDANEAVSSDPLDCNDASAAIRPGATELAADFVDQNCDGAELCFIDADDDGYRPNATATIASADLDCTDSREALSSDPTTDCDDSNSSVRPGAVEGVADGVDQNCDTQELCYLDADNDGYRPNATATVVSTNLSCGDAGEAAPTDPITDCNDSNASLNPGVNADGDAYHSCVDCDDTRSYLPDGRLVVTGPGASVACDNILDCGGAFANSDLTVSGAAGTIEDVNITVNIDHGSVGDLEIWVLNPASTQRMLFNEHGGGGNNLSGTVFDDEAATAISAGGAPFTGSYRPTDTLSPYDGASPNGNWRLRIRDNDWFDDGALLNWSVSFDMACP